MSKNLKSIGSGAFSGCKGLMYITIPKSITSIGDFAFSRCSETLRIYCEVNKAPSGWDKYWNNGGYAVIWGYNDN